MKDEKVGRTSRTINEGSTQGKNNAKGSCKKERVLLKLGLSQGEG